MKEMRSKAVVVLVNAKTGDFDKMPVPVREALAKPELGSMIPRIAVFDKTREHSLGGVAYKQLGDKKVIRSLENAMHDYAKAGAIPGGVEADEPAADPASSDLAEDTAKKLGEDGKISDADLTGWTRERWNQNSGSSHPVCRWQTDPLA